MKMVLNDCLFFMQFTIQKVNSEIKKIKKIMKKYN